MDKFEYPLISMSVFTNLCYKQGQGYLKAIVKPIPPKPDPVARLMARADTKKQIGKDARRRSSILSSASAKEPEEEKPKELYTIDLQSAVYKVLDNRKSKLQLKGEHIKSQGESLVVDISGFYAHLIKIALIWCNG